MRILQPLRVFLLIYLLSSLPVTGHAWEGPLNSGPAIVLPINLAPFAGTRTRLRQSVIQSFIVTNTGDEPLTISPASYFGGNNPGDYALVRLPLRAIQPNASDTVTLRFSPTGEGLRLDTLYLVSNATNGTQVISLRGVGIIPRLLIDSFYSTPALYNFDSVAVGKRKCIQIALSNPGSDTIAITQNYFAGHDLDFTVMPLAGKDTLIAPGETRLVTLCFAPIQRGYRTARIILRTDISLTFDNPPRDTSQFIINLTGTGVPRSDSSSDLGSLHFEELTLEDTTCMGSQVCLLDTIKNSGSRSVSVTRISIAGKDSADYVYEGVLVPFTLPPDSTKILTLCCTPDSDGERIASLLVRAVSNSDTLNAWQTLEVFGLGGTNVAVVGLTDTPTIIVGCPRYYATRTGFYWNSFTFVDTIFNLGTDSLIVDSITITGPGSSVYSDSGIQFPFTLAPGASRLISILGEPPGYDKRPTSAFFTVQLNVIAQNNCGQNGVTTITHTVAADYWGAGISKALENGPYCVGESDSSGNITIEHSSGSCYPTSYSIRFEGPDSADWTLHDSISPPLDTGEWFAFRPIFRPSHFGPSRVKVILTAYINGVPVPPEFTIYGPFETLTGGPDAPSLVSDTGSGTARVGSSTQIRVLARNVGEYRWNRGKPTMSGPFTFDSLSSVPVIAGLDSGVLVFDYTPTRNGQVMGNAIFPNADCPLAADTIQLIGMGFGSSFVPLLAESYGFSISASYPNPFRTKTSLEVIVPKAAEVSMNVLNEGGEIVCRLLHERMVAGHYEVTISADDLPSGAYYIQCRAGNVTLTEMIELTK